MGWVWNPHRRQFTRSVQFGQVNRVASVGFDPIAGLAPKNPTTGRLRRAFVLRLRSAGAECRNRKGQPHSKIG